MVLRIALRAARLRRAIEYARHGRSIGGESPLEEEVVLTPSRRQLRRRLARRTITFTKNGSLRQNQEMLDFCARHGIGAEVETVPADQANSALERLDKGDVRYRFVIDASTFSPSG